MAQRIHFTSQLTSMQIYLQLSYISIEIIYVLIVKCKNSNFSLHPKLCNRNVCMFEPNVS